MVWNAVMFQDESQVWEIISRTAEGAAVVATAKAINMKLPTGGFRIVSVVAG